MTDEKINEEIIEAIKPILDRYVATHPEARVPGFFINFFVGIGVGAGIDDGFQDKDILDAVRKTALSTLAERR